MFYRTGNKIKILAKIIGIGVFSLCMIIALFGLANINTYGIVVMITSLIFGLFCIVSCWPLYGFGELIRRITSIDNKLNNNPISQYDKDNNNSIKENIDKIEEEAEEVEEEYIGPISSIECGSKC
jgi:hypothetical protein